jgi:hypothetical protein
MRAFIIIASLFCISIAGLVSVPAIHQWERENGFPFGRMCEPNFFTFYQDTCPKR